MLHRPPFHDKQSSQPSADLPRPTMDLSSSAYQYSSKHPCKRLTCRSVWVWYEFLESLKIERRGRAPHFSEDHEVSCVPVCSSERHPKGLQFRHEPFQAEYDVVGSTEPLSRPASRILSGLYCSDGHHSHRWNVSLRGHLQFHPALSYHSAPLLQYPLPTWGRALHKHVILYVAHRPLGLNYDSDEVAGSDWEHVALHGDQRKGLRKTIGAILET